MHASKLIGDAPEPDPGSSNPPQVPRLDAQDVHFQAGDREILAGIDLTLRPGERLGVIGPNGSGKSTLLRCLYAWHTPTAGAVFLSGERIERVPRRRRAQTISVLVQEAESSLGLTVDEVVALGRLPHREVFGRPSEADRQAVEQAIGTVGLTEWRARSYATL